MIVGYSVEGTRWEAEIGFGHEKRLGKFDTLEEAKEAFQRYSLMKDKYEKIHLCEWRRYRGVRILPIETWVNRRPDEPQS